MMFRIGMISALVLQAALGQAPQNLKSSEVLPDNRVVFRIYAPNAKEVSVAGEFGIPIRGPLQKDASGVWSITLGPLAPDYYTYSFTVDGVRTADPRNGMIRPGLNNVSNMFLVPGPESAFQEMQNLPHGEMREVWYDSKTLGVQRRMHVYTPPGYDRTSARLPVLYLVHGGGEDDMSWVVGGRAGFILDNLIAAGKAKPMIVVMPNGNVPVPNAGAGNAGGQDRATTAVKQRDLFISDLLTGIIPYAESNYRVIPNRENRALAGFSFGGSQTLRAMILDSDQFASIGIFSMGIMVGSSAGAGSIAGAASGSVADFEKDAAVFLADPEKTNRSMKLIWIGGGKDDTTVGNSPLLLDQTLTAHKILHQYHETPGGHSYANWRPYLRDFAQLLFR
jgi:enterochelin esterase-like enzyme